MVDKKTIKELLVCDYIPVALCSYILVAIFTYGHAWNRVSVTKENASLKVYTTFFSSVFWPVYWSIRLQEK